MPTTKTGEALLRDMLDPDEPLFPMDPGATIAAIEAEAREDEARAWNIAGTEAQKEAIAAERARIRREVEESDELGRAAVSLVLRIIDGENSDAQ